MTQAATLGEILAEGGGSSWQDNILWYMVHLANLDCLSNPPAC